MKQIKQLAYTNKETDSIVKVLIPKFYDITASSQGSSYRKKYIVN